MADYSQFVTVLDFEKHAGKVLQPQAFDYYRSGAGAEVSLKLNREAFARLRIRPRFLRDVSRRDLRVTVLGECVNFPIGVSPTAMQKMAHPNGECANVRAAASLGTVFIQSTISTCSIEEVAHAAGGGIRWFQLYIYKDRNVTRRLVERAEKNGFKALVLTVDAPFFGTRVADIKNKFALPSHLRMANFEDDTAATRINRSKGGSGINEYVNELFDQSLTWEDINWLKSITKLPLVLKGVLTAEDAVRGVELGVAAILVSNHGARQVDTVPAPIEVLPEIVEAVGDKCEVYLDGGVRQGTDVFKALALGAKMVFVGRPALWGLAHSGENGARRVLEILRNELDNTMALSGCSSIRDIKREMVVSSQRYYSKL